MSLGSRSEHSQASEFRWGSVCKETRKMWVRARVVGLAPGAERSPGATGSGTGFPCFSSRSRLITVAHTEPWLCSMLSPDPGHTCYMFSPDLIIYCALTWSHWPLVTLSVLTLVTLWTPPFSQIDPDPIHSVDTDPRIIPQFSYNKHHWAQEKWMNELGWPFQSDWTSCSPRSVPHPHRARVPSLTLDGVSLCRPSLPATYGPDSNPRSSPESCRPACRACTTSHPWRCWRPACRRWSWPRTLWWPPRSWGGGSGCWATWASAGNRAESPRLTCFSAQLHADLLWPWKNPGSLGSAPSNGALFSMPIVFHENQRVLGWTHSRRWAARRPSPQAPGLARHGLLPRSRPCVKHMLITPHTSLRLTCILGHTCHKPCLEPLPARAPPFKFQISVLASFFQGDCRCTESDDHNPWLW